MESNDALTEPNQHLSGLQDSIPSDILMSEQEDSSFQNQIHLSRNERKQVYQQMASAAFYDKMMESMQDGDNEELAQFKANAAVNAIEFELETLNMRDTVNKKMNARKTTHANQEGMDAILSKTNTNPQDLLDDIDSENEFDEEDEDQEEEEEEIHEFKDGRSSAQNALGRLQSAMDKIKGKPVGDGLELEFHKCRDVHRRLMMVVTQYDKILELANQNNLDKMTETLKEEMMKGDQELRAQMERRINHNECEIKISSLSKELFILKSETANTLEQNQRLYKQVNELKLFKSNAENETKLMMSQLTKRKIKIRMLKKKMSLLEKQIQEYESIPKLKGSRASSSAHMTFESETSDYHTDHSMQDHSNANANNNYNELSDMNRTIENTQTEDDDDESIQEDALKEWLDQTIKSKPKWNSNRNTYGIRDTISTKSIMHQDEEQVQDEPEQQQEKHTTDKQELSSQIHKKCFKESQRLKRLLAIERLEHKKDAILVAKKSQKPTRILQILYECLESLNSSKDSQDHNKEEVIQMLEQVYQKRDLIQSLIHHVQDPTDKEETECWSASERVVSEYKKSTTTNTRPCSAATSGFHKERPTSGKSRASTLPIVSVVLKENIKEKREKAFKESNPKPVIQKQKLDSISTWIKKIETRHTTQVYSKHGMVTTELISQVAPAIVPTPPPPQSIQKSTSSPTRPTSARTTTSSVRFAPTPSTNDKKLKRPSSALVKIKTPFIDF